MGEPDDLHPSALSVARTLRARGVAGSILQFRESTKTAAQAAAAIGCPVGAIASCLVFVLDDEPVVIIKSGAFRVEPTLFVERVGGHSLRRASPEEVRAATGQPIGGVSPVGWPAALRVFVDDSLRQFDVLWAACGTPNAVFATTFAELSELTNGAPVNLLP